MSNIMQYLIQMSDEFRESYEKIDRRIDSIKDKIDLLVFTQRELEQRINTNRDTNKN